MGTRLTAAIAAISAAVCFDVFSRSVWLTLHIPSPRCRDQCPPACRRPHRRAAVGAQPAPSWAGHTDVVRSQSNPRRSRDAGVGCGHDQVVRAVASELRVSWAPRLLVRGIVPGMNPALSSEPRQVRSAGGPSGGDSSLGCQERRSLSSLSIAVTAWTLCPDAEPGSASYSGQLLAAVRWLIKLALRLGSSPRAPRAPDASPTPGAAAGRSVTAEFDGPASLPSCWGSRPDGSVGRPFGRTGSSTEEPRALGSVRPIARRFIAREAERWIRGTTCRGACSTLCYACPVDRDRHRHRGGSHSLLRWPRAKYLCEGLAASRAISVCSWCRRLDRRARSRLLRDLLVSIAVASGSAATAAGVVFGSNVFNIAFLLGGAALAAG